MKILVKTFNIFLYTYVYCFKTHLNDDSLTVYHELEMKSACSNLLAAELLYVLKRASTESSMQLANITNTFIVLLSKQIINIHITTKQHKEQNIVALK